MPRIEARLMIYTVKLSANCEAAWIRCFKSSVKNSLFVTLSQADRLGLGSKCYLNFTLKLNKGNSVELPLSKLIMPYGNCGKQKQIRVP